MDPPIFGGDQPRSSSHSAPTTPAADGHVKRIVLAVLAVLGPVSTHHHPLPVTRPPTTPPLLEALGSRSSAATPTAPLTASIADVGHYARPAAPITTLEGQETLVRACLWADFLSYDAILLSETALSLGALSVPTWWGDAADDDDAAFDAATGSDPLPTALPTAEPTTAEEWKVRGLQILRDHLGPAFRSALRALPTLVSADTSDDAVDHLVLAANARTTSYRTAFSRPSCLAACLGRLAQESFHARSILAETREALATREAHINDLLKSAAGASSSVRERDAEVESLHQRLTTIDGRYGDELSALQRERDKLLLRTRDLETNLQDVQTRLAAVRQDELTVLREKEARHSETGQLRDQLMKKEQEVFTLREALATQTLLAEQRQTAVVDLTKRNDALLKEISELAEGSAVRMAARAAAAGYTTFDNHHTSGGGSTPSPRPSETQHGPPGASSPTTSVALLTMKQKFEGILEEKSTEISILRRTAGALKDHNERLQRTVEEFETLLTEQAGKVKEADFRTASEVNKCRIVTEELHSMERARDQLRHDMQAVKKELNAQKLLSSELDDKGKLLRQQLDNATASLTTALGALEVKKGEINAHLRDQRTRAEIISKHETNTVSLHAELATFTQRCAHQDVVLRDNAQLIATLRQECRRYEQLASSLRQRYRVGDTAAWLDMPSATTPSGTMGVTKYTPAAAGAPHDGADGSDYQREAADNVTAVLGHRPRHGSMASGKATPSSPSTPPVTPRTPRSGKLARSDGSDRSIVEVLQDEVTMQEKARRDAEALSLDLRTALTKAETVIEALQHQLGGQEDQTRVVVQDVFNRLLRLPNYDHLVEHVFQAKEVHSENAALHVKLAAATSRVQTLAVRCRVLERHLEEWSSGKLHASATSSRGASPESDRTLSAPPATSDDPGVQEATAQALDGSSSPLRKPPDDTLPPSSAAGSAEAFAGASGTELGRRMDKVIYGAATSHRTTHRVASASAPATSRGRSAVELHVAIGATTPLADAREGGSRSDTPSSTTEEDSDDNDDDRRGRAAPEEDGSNHGNSHRSSGAHGGDGEAATLSRRHRRDNSPRRNRSSVAHQAESRSTPASGVPRGALFLPTSSVPMSTATVDRAPALHALQEKIARLDAMRDHLHNLDAHAAASSNGAFRSALASSTARSLRNVDRDDVLQEAWSLLPKSQSAVANAELRTRLGLDVPKMASPSLKSGQSLTPRGSASTPLMAAAANPTSLHRLPGVVSSSIQNRRKTQQQWAAAAAVVGSQLSADKPSVAFGGGSGRWKGGAR